MDEDPMLAQGEDLLSQALGIRIRFTNVQRLSALGRRNLVLRCSTEAASVTASGREVPSSVIIKKVIGEPYTSADMQSWDTQRFVSDFAGIRFLNDIKGDRSRNRAWDVPQCYAGAVDLGIILLEDLGTGHRTLEQVLAGHSAEEAADALVRYAVSLGRLQADTLGKEARYEIEVQRVRSGARCSQRGFDNLEQLIETLHEFGATDRQFDDELAELVARILHPGKIAAYLHGDPCPVNVLVADDVMFRIDFEFGQYGHPFTDLACCRMMLPTCGFASWIPSGLINEMESVYRSEIVRVHEGFNHDEIFFAALVDACAYWLLITLGFHLPHALLNDKVWGLATIRSRILSRLEVFVEMSQAVEHLPSLRSASVRMLEILSSAWGGVPRLSPFPAFQTYRGQQRGLKPW